MYWGAIGVSSPVGLWVSEPQTAGRKPLLGDANHTPSLIPPASPTCGSSVCAFHIQRRCPGADVRGCAAARPQALPGAGCSVPGLTGHRLVGSCLNGRRGCLEEKQDRNSVLFPSPAQAEHRQHWGGPQGAQGHTDTGCFCFPAGRCTWRARGAARQPTPRGYSWIRPMAPGTARQERLERGARGHESKRRPPARRRQLAG